MGKVFQRYNLYHAKQKFLFSFVFHSKIFCMIIYGKRFFPSLDAAGARLQNVLEVLIFLPLVLVTKQTKEEGRERKKEGRRENQPAKLICGREKML